MKDFNKYFDFIADDETKLMVKKVIDKARLSIKNCSIYVTDFNNDNVINYCLPYFKNEEISFKLFPTYEFAERKSLILFPDFIDCECIYEKDYYNALRVCNKSSFQDLDHKNYLGSIMSLGIDRSKIGDIYVHDDFADIICQNDIVDVIIYNLDKIGKNKVDIEQISLENVKYKEPDNETIIINISSNRLDNVIKSLINKQRDVCTKLISTGDVKVNFETVTRLIYSIKKNDLISIRRFGRFRIIDELGISKSGKIKIEVKHYIKK